MQQNDLLELLEPIKEFITKNEVTEEQVPDVVQRFFPPITKLQEISKYLQLNLPSYRTLSQEAMLQRTIEVISGALNDSAIEVYRLKYKSTKISQHEIDEELADYEWEDEYEEDSFAD